VQFFRVLPGSAGEEMVAVLAVIASVAASAEQADAPAREPIAALFRVSGAGQIAHAGTAFDRPALAFTARLGGRFLWPAETFGAVSFP
jgi:hypothetical protein